MREEGFPGGAVVQNPPMDTGDMGSVSDPEDLTCHGTTKPMCHSYQARALEPGNCDYEAHMPQSPSSTKEKPLLREAWPSQCRVAPGHHN